MKHGRRLAEFGWKGFDGLRAARRAGSGLLVFGMSFVGTAHGDMDDYPRESDPDPERFEEEIDAFSKADEKEMPEKGAIVCTGSSSMRMWHSQIEEDLEGLTVIPRGFGGSHFSDLIYFADTLILKYEPRAVLVYEGDNDSASGKSPERIRGDLEYLVTYCRRSLPDLRFYVISIKPSVERAGIWDVAEASNAAMEDFCERTIGVTFIDVAEAMLDSNGKVRQDIFIDDDLHLNERGYAIWASQIAPVLQAGERKYE